MFVYGTLLLNIQSSIATFLKENAQFVGEGYLFGHLFDLGHYFGAVFQKEASTSIYGHVFKLKNPNYSLPILDKYEAVGEQSSQSKEYAREIVPIKLEGEIISCWVYVSRCYLRRIYR